MADSAETTIERLDMNDQVWTLIKVAADVLTARCYPIVAPISEMEIAIVGGYDGGTLVGNSIYFNVENESVYNVGED